MKRLTTLLLLCAMVFPAIAQTAFRSITFEEALKVAAQEKKLVFIDFYTDWCGPCKKMAREVFPLKEVGDFMNAKFVNLKLNAEKEGRELAARYKVNAYPTFVVVDTQGKVVTELKGSMSGQAFIEKLGGKLNPEMTPVRLAERYQAGERTPELVNNYAMNLMEQRKEEEGFKVVNEYFESLTEAQRLAPENLFLYTRYTVNVEDPKADFMVEHRNDFAEANREEIMQRISRLYNSVLSTYFSGHIWANKLYNEEKYQALKSKLQELGLVEKNNYAPMFRLIEQRITGNDKAFLELCRKEYDNLSDSAKSLLIMNITRLLPTKDPEILRGMSQFVRGQLATATPVVITLAGRILQELEAGFDSK
ncbi:MAG: thioredoxin family protein [Bacteroides sp.]|nr:thioredoxin family protein [Bacteroides sp.]